jgi:hypothetical protein
MELEKEVLKSVKYAVSKSVHDSMTKYGSPLSKLTDKVIQDNSTKIYELVNKIFTEILGSKELENQLREEFKHKIAKLLVSNTVGMTEKQLNKLKQDPIMKAKVIVAIESVLNS